MIKILFTGDICISGTYLNKFNAGSSIFCDLLRKEFATVDYTVANFEGAETVHENILRKDIRIVNPVGSIKYLTSENIRVYNLANNHIFDCGKQGFIETRSAVLQCNALYFGAGENIDEACAPIYLEKNNVRIALIGVSHREGPVAGKHSFGVFSERNFGKLKDTIRSARENSDWLVLNYHGGEEFTNYPSPIKRRVLRKYAEIDGVDLIVSHHSHMLQGYERINNVPVFYSLGNFVFDINHHLKYPGVHKGGVLRVNFDKSIFTFDFINVELDMKTGMTKFLNDEYFDFLTEKLKKGYDWSEKAYEILFPVPREHQNHSEKKMQFRFSLLSRLFFIISHKFLLATYLNAYRYKTQLWFKKTISNKVNS